MFAGGAAAGRHINSNNVRNMQLFHELKQKFPTVPDQVVSSCIATHNANPATTSLNDLLLLHQQQQQSREHSREQSQERLPSVSIPNNNIDNHGNHMGGRNTIAALPPEIPCSTPLILSCVSDNDDNDNVVPHSPDKNGPYNFELVTDEHRTCDQSAPATISIPTPNEASTHDEMHATNMPYYPLKSSELPKPILQTVQSPECDTNGGENETKPSTLRRFIKRPNNLAVKSIHYSGATSKRAGNAGNKIQPSERHNDLHTLLNSNETAMMYWKPPKAPGATGKPPPPVLAPKPGRPQTVASQTTDTLLLPLTTHSPTSNVNLSLNVVVSPNNNEMCSPRPPTPPPKPSGAAPCRHTTNLHVVPEPDWMQPPQSGQSGRSYTSVNLTLRPPTTQPQAPIDITSQNATLTYSTSSFDRTRGLQSRLEISVGPGGQSTVSSVRRQRPKSSYHPVLNELCEDGVGNSVAGGGGGDVIGDGLQTTTSGNMIAAGSLPNLATDEKATTVILEQQVRINRLRIELLTEKTRLVAMQREVTDLEAIAAAATTTTTATATTAPITTPLTTVATIEKTEDIEVERQLQREIRHLRGQCEQLAHAVDQRSESGVPLGETSREFYQNIYTGQQGSISVTSSATADYTARRIATVTGQSQMGGNQGASNIPPISTPITSTTGRPPQPSLPHTFHRQHQPNNSQVHPQLQLQDETEDQSCWNCSVCTFQNHPLLNKCEQCEMLRGNTPSAKPTTTTSQHNLPPPYSPHPPSPHTPNTPNSARSNHHSLTPPRSWLSSNNPNNCSPGSSGGSSASTPGSTNRSYPVQQYQILPPGYMPSVYGPPAAIPWVFPANSMPVNTNPAVYNMQNSAYYVANSDAYSRRSSEGSGSALRPAPPIPGSVAPKPPARTSHHSHSLSQPDNTNTTGRGGTAHR